VGGAETKHILAIAPTDNDIYLGLLYPGAILEKPATLLFMNPTARLSPWNDNPIKLRCLIHSPLPGDHIISDLILFIHL